MAAPVQVSPRPAFKAALTAKAVAPGRLDFLRADAVLGALDELERDPEAGYEVRARLFGLWSDPVGVYRIIYERRDSRTVRVVAIRRRDQAHETDPRQ